MDVLVYDAHSYDQTFLKAANSGQHNLVFTTAQLDATTVALAQDYPAICCFVNDRADAAVLERLAAGQTRLIVLRATGFNNVDLVAAQRLGITVMRVAYYSPYAVAEFAVGLLQTLNRRIHRAYNRTREFNFRLAGLLGQDIHGKTVGVIGTGKIGAAFASIMRGFGCQLLGYDLFENPACHDLGLTYLPLEELLQQSDILSLHLPLTPDTYHLINHTTLALLKPTALLINTSRGGLIDTDALIHALRGQQIGGVALDVYEEEDGVFFQDLSDRVMTDDTLARLMTFGNVLVTGHQAFFTYEAVTTIAETTITNINDFAAGNTNANVLLPH